MADLIEGSRLYETALEQAKAANLARDLICAKDIQEVVVKVAPNIWAGYVPLDFYA